MPERDGVSIQGCPGFTHLCIEMTVGGGETLTGMGIMGSRRGMGWEIVSFICRGGRNKAELHSELIQMDEIDRMDGMDGD